VRLEESEGYVTETYRSDLPYNPSFSCAPYHVMSEEIPGMRIDIFMPESVELSPEMLTSVGEIMTLYQENLGNLSAQSFHIVFPEMSSDEGGGESNGNLIILANIQPFLNYDEDETAKDMFANLVAHEGYHLWNAWSLKWEGPLADWWVVEVEVDRDYELFTALGYKTSPEEDWRRINLNISGRGSHLIKFACDAQPLEIQVDPDYRVPQINMENNTWTAGSDF